ncbi:putative protein kinase RLK-Pelle-DLSV family [Helianthus annuus]|nr:putative protein kinase RLK-Pelle-DLSV family [Helianthus annuus]
MQCLTALSAQQCGDCLDDCLLKVKELYKPVPIRRQVKVYTTSCVIRYENYQLFNSTWFPASTSSGGLDNVLGEGGFGCVYKIYTVCVLQNGQTIAETARNSSQGVVEFKTEVNLVVKVQHKNLVRLLGYCVQEPERLLVYKYMGIGSQQRNHLKLPHDSLEVYLHTCNILDDDDDTDDELYAYFFV